jgi:hypothetical protein
MADDFSRVWIDDLDDLDAEQLNDLEARQEARVGAIGGGISIGYQTNGTSFTTSSTAVTGVDVTGLSTTVVVGSRPINVSVRADAWNAGAALGGQLFLNEDGANIGIIAAALGDNYSTLFGTRRLQPAAGSHTYKIRARNNSAGTVTIQGGPGTANLVSPMAIEVLEV